MRQVLRLLYSILACVFIFGCANYGSITGGEKDEVPPTVIVEESEPNFQTNYIPTKIELKFDEWVKLNNPGKNILVSPVLNKNLRFKVKGKSIVSEIDTSYKFAPNTTYQIQFIDAVQDITENNPLVNYKFVFSTGNVLDSSVIAGNIMLLNPNQKLKGDAKAMLYQEWIDTTFIAQKPLYIAQIKKDSSVFHFDYLPVDSFYLTVTAEDNENGVYEKGIDFIGYTSKPIVSSDSTIADSIVLFVETLPLALESIDTTFLHQANLKWNLPPRHLIINCDSCVIEKKLADYSLFNIKKSYPWIIELKDSAENFIDTVIVNTSNEKSPINLEIDMSSSQENIAIDNPIKIKLNQPIDTLNTQLRLVIDNDTSSLEIETTKGNTHLDIPRQLTKKDTAVYIEIPSQNLKGLQGKNKDTLILRWNQNQKRDKGSLLLKISGLDSLKNYVIIGKDKEKEILYDVIDNKSNYEQLFIMKPGKFRLELIQDENKNGRWDSGHPESFSPFEPIWFYDVTEVRANWEVPFEIKLE